MFKGGAKTIKHYYMALSMAKSLQYTFTLECGCSGKLSYIQGNTAREIFYIEDLYEVLSII